MHSIGKALQSRSKHCKTSIWAVQNTVECFRCFWASCLTFYCKTSRLLLMFCLKTFYNLDSSSKMWQTLHSFHVGTSQYWAASHRGRKLNSNIFNLINLKLLLSSKDWNYLLHCDAHWKGGPVKLACLYSLGWGIWDCNLGRFPFICLKSSWTQLLQIWMQTIQHIQLRSSSY